MYRLPVTAMVAVGFAILETRSSCTCTICYLFRNVAIGTATISAALSDRRMQMWVKMAAASFSRFSNNEHFCPPGRLAATISERLAVVSESDAEKKGGIVFPKLVSTPSKTLLARSPKNAPVTYFSNVYFPGRRDAASNSRSHSVLMKSRQPEWKFKACSLEK